MENPIVSVVMITYGHEDYIEEAINGVLIQRTTFPIELIIANDNSPDSTDTIVNNLLRPHPKSNIIKYIKHQENIGMMANFIFSLKQCKGKYIAICEGDDYWTDPNKLQKQVDFLEANPEYVITYTDIQPFDSDGDILNEFGGAKKDLEAIELQKCASLYTLTTCFRNIIKDFPYEMRSSAFGDLFVWSLLGNYGKGKYLDNIKPSRYRLHNGGVFSKKTKKEKFLMSSKTNSALFLYYDRVKNPELSTYFFEEYMIATIRTYGFFSMIKILFKYLFKIMKVKLIYKR